jgi:hypothetical protein
MGNAKKTQVSENDPKLVLENGDQNTADTVVNDAQIVSSEEKKDLVWIRVLLPLAGKFLMSHDPGHEIEIDPNQAQAIVDAGYGEFISDEDLENSI